MGTLLSIRPEPRVWGLGTDTSAQRPRLPSRGLSQAPSKVTEGSHCQRQGAGKQAAESAVGGGGRLRDGGGRTACRVLNGSLLFPRPSVFTGCVWGGLVSTSLQVSGVRFCDTSSAYCMVCSSPEPLSFHPSPFVPLRPPLPPPRCPALC